MSYKKFSLFLLFTIFTLLFNNVNAYQIASNHSYVKNSTFTTDHTININGYGDFKLMYTNEDTESDKQNITTSSENEISLDFNLEKELDEITKIGVHYIPVLNSKYQEFDRFYIYLDGYYGKMEIGNTTNVFNNMKIGADTIALGSGGINSSFTKQVKLENNYIYILSPNSFTSQNFGFYNNSIDANNWNDSKYLTKINYYSPEFFGFQFGFSITPNVKLKKDYLGNNIATSIGYGEEMDLGTFINYGVSYINTFGNVGLALSLTGETNISNSLNKKNDVEEDIKSSFDSMEFGMNLNYFGLTFAGSVGYLETNIDVNTPIKSFKSAMKKGEYKTYGFAYEMSDVSVSLTRFESEYKNYTTFEATSYAIEKNVSKGVSAYVEYTDYISSVVSTNKEYSGNSIFVGVIVNFN